MPAPHDIGPYRIVRPLGEGGMGAVYLARDDRLNRAVAIKLVSGVDARSLSARQDLLNEARAAAAFNHPHIASVHDVLDADGQVAIVFEYVEGETLADRMKRGMLPVGEAISIALQLADALMAAHQRGIVHRDLKPANVAITPDNVVKVLDFGVARDMPDAIDNALAARTTATGFVGTIGYAAPEQCFGNAVDARADIFSLGVVLFEMLTGRLPFAAADTPSLVREMLSDHPPHVRALIPTVPGELDGLITRMLAADPAKRPASAREVRDALRALAPTERVTGVSTKPVRHPWAIGALIAATAVTGALVTPLLRREPANAPDKPPVVAVLPLANASGDAANDYLAVGLADSLVTRLAGLQSVTVLSRSAAANARAQGKDSAVIAADLDATYLVDGSVQLIGDRLRVSLNLIRADAAVAWADAVEGPVSSLFELQTRIASALAQAVVVQLSAADRVALAHQTTMNPEAFAAYSRGRALLDRRDIRGNTRAALAAFEEATERDPSFADAYAGRGEALWDLYLGTKDPALAQAAVDAGVEALRLAPDRASVRYSLALTLKGRGELRQAADELQRALILRPNYDDARRELGDVLARQGRLEEAIAEFRAAIALRPGYWPHYNALGSSLLRAARYEEAAEAFSRVLERQSDNASAHANLGAAYQFLGRLDEALASYERAVAIRPTPAAYSNIGSIHHRRGEFARAVEAYNRALQLAPNVAATHRNLGDAYRRLKRSSDAQAAYRNAVRLTQADLSVNRNDPLLNASLAVYAAKAGDTALAHRQLQIVDDLGASDVEVLYRVAVAHALVRAPDRAMEALERAVASGYSPTEVAVDDDLATLHGDPRFTALVTAVR
jgi:tetratricopeptide (TPR) repeat protein